ncbi:hypothetical protein AB205_0083150 [Aquarana catesbeiana]|uniref:rRNA 2'-O-methyltransferase fibrillarin n=1 Tax=Aquarana catesbeiana TaxID=8400 RepID=A0A2G9RUB2_AQUCT|nr:hypothetical protein AB205_0083150 [Aquarana catesbeiana]
MLLWGTTVGVGTLACTEADEIILVPESELKSHCWFSANRYQAAVDMAFHPLQEETPEVNPAVVLVVVLTRSLTFFFSFFQDSVPEVVAEASVTAEAEVDSVTAEAEVDSVTAEAEVGSVDVAEEGLVIVAAEEDLVIVAAEEGETKIEYRTWNPFRSKLAAAILGGVDQIHIKPGAKVLYLGAASGTTVSHVSDLVGPANCIDSTAAPEAVFASEVKKMQQENMKPQEQLTLEPYERDHAVVVGIYRPPPKQKK